MAGAAVVAGAANLANLLDLRPGRALKVTLLAAAPLLRRSGCAARRRRRRRGGAGAALGALPDDLAGTGHARRHRRQQRRRPGRSGAASSAPACAAGVAALAVLAALTLASEKVSFTAVIEATPGLRELDALGRRPAR